MKKVCETYGKPSRKWNDVCITRVQEEEREKWVESSFKEIVAGKFPALGRDVDNQIHKTNRLYENLNLKPVSLCKL